jgi:hypothetical protein
VQHGGKGMANPEIHDNQHTPEQKQSYEAHQSEWVSIKSS